MDLRVYCEYLRMSVINILPANIIIINNTDIITVGVLYYENDNDTNVNLCY